MGSKVSGGLLLLVGLFFSATAMAAQNGEVASLINKRLSYMKDVAGYKRTIILPLKIYLRKPRCCPAQC